MLETSGSTNPDRRNGCVEGCISTKNFDNRFFHCHMLQLQLSIQQCVALVFLFVRIGFVQLDEQWNNDVGKFMNGPATATIVGQLNSTNEGDTRVIHKHIINQNPIKGFIAALAAAIMSGFTGTYFEKFLKTTDVSIWIHNIQLALISLPVALASVFIKDGEKVLEEGFFVGFYSMVWVTILVGSLGGLIVSIIIKFGDNISKTIATSTAIIVVCIVSVFLFNFKPSYIFISGTGFVISAMFIYSIFPYRARSNATAADDLPNA